MSVYVAGPVERAWRLLPDWVVTCYELIESASERTGSIARRPYAEKDLDALGAEKFSAEIQNRIKKADHVVAVFLPNDPSVPVECAIAALTGKRVMLIHNEARGLPRIFAGLGGLRLELWGSTTANSIRRFLAIS